MHRVPLVRRYVGLLAAAGVLAALAASGTAEARSAVPLQPFVVDNVHRGEGIDMRFLSDAVAGARGFVGVKDGHLATADGRRFRCWGVNLAGWTAGSALLPPHADAERYAASLAKLGVNCVRFQFLDLPDSGRKVKSYDSGEDLGLQLPAGLIDDARDDTRAFDADALDRLDYLAFQLKSHGIYIDFNLNVGRVYKAGDGVPDSDLIGNAKALTYFAPEIVALEKQYARDLLTHVNPYTKTAYAAEPAVALVEIVNENSLLEFWMRNWLRGANTAETPAVQLDLTPHYKALLTRMYNDWLAKNRAAQLVSLRKIAGVAPGAEVPLLARADFAAAPRARFAAEIAFLTHVETSFLDGMRRYLSDDLGVKMPVIGSNDHTYFISGLPHLRANARMAVQDAHVYWQHPAISGRRDTPMVDAPEQSVVVKLARTAMAGKPFTVSEVNEPGPSDYGAELIPILASYAAFQDWDGVFFYCLEPKLSGAWQGMMGDYFDIAQDPVKIAALPLGAAIFLRHDVAAAKQMVARSYSTVEIDESARLSAAAAPYFSPGFPAALPLVHGSRIRCLDCAPMGAIAPPKPVKGKDYLSDTGELRWHMGGARKGLVTVSTPRSEALVGFVRAAAARDAVSTNHLSADIANDFSVLGLTSLDGKPLSRAGRMMLVAAARAENSGAVWDARHAMLTSWGKAPTKIEPVTGWILLKDLDGAVRVTATPLDGAGNPGTPVEARMLEAGWEFPVGAPAATNYLISVTR